MSIFLTIKNSCDKMVKISRVIVVIVLFAIFFEIGLFSSYTIVTSEVPDPQGLIDMQIEQFNEVFNINKVNDALIKDPTQINISNKQDVSLVIQNESKVDGINLDSMNVTTYNDTDDEKFNVTIKALGYSSPNSTSSQIVISNDPSFSVVATANAGHRNGEYYVDTDSIKIESILKLY